MSDQKASSVISNEVWLQHPHGRIFARIWSPASDRNKILTDIPIVLFHDSLGCVDLWRSFPAELSAATGHRVIAYDRLGFGRSDPRYDRLTMDFIAVEAKNFFPVIREQLHFTRFIAFGHSVGGGMAANCAAEFASDCEVLITESAQAFPEDRTLQGILVAKEQFKEHKQFQRLKKYHGEKAEWVLDAWTETWLHPAFASWSLESVMPRVLCPLLAIHGDLDEYGSTRHPKMLSQFCGGPSQVEIMPDIHHMPHRERSEMVIRLVSDFISSAGGTTAQER